MDVKPALLGIHHLTAVCSDARRTAGFYTWLLGLRLVKKTVNFDDPAAYHLYFGDDTGTPGTLITFFEWPHMPKGQWGIGATHHLAFIVETREGQLQWKRRLLDRGIAVTGPYDRMYFHSIYFEDPDGLILEIATRGPGWTVDEGPEALGARLIAPPEGLTKEGRNEEEIACLTWPEPVGTVSPSMKLKGLHHITALSSDIGLTTKFYTELLGLRLVKRTFNYDNPTAPHYYFGAGGAGPGTVITYFGYSPDRMRQGSMGVGLTHHFAFAVGSEKEQDAWRASLVKANVRVTPVMDRVYFKSIYFRDPDGHILEIATAGPGFIVDEPREDLGRNLKLPGWLEPDRKEIEKSLVPLP